MASESVPEQGQADAPLTDWCDALAEATAPANASTALAATGPEDGVDPSRPVPPELPTDAWALIMDRVASCRCAGVTP